MKAKIPHILVLSIFIVSVVLPVRAENLPDKQTKQKQKNEKTLIGLYYFKTKQLEALDFNIGVVRLVIPWGAVETEKGEFLWGAQPIRWIDYCLENKIEVIPVIRTIRHRGKKRCSSPPEDLTPFFNNDYAYSRSYYNFITEIARGYKGKFKIVVIENEVTAKNFWCGTMDEYLLLLLTARKAFQDVDPEVKIADSGIPSTIWGFLMTKEMLEENKESQALEFYQAYFKESFLPKPETISQLKMLFKKKFIQESIKKAEYLLEKLPGYVDIINFHYYEPAALYPEVVAFIKKKTKNKPLMTNELGTRIALDAPEREEKAIQDMIKKLSLSRKLKLKAVIWFPFTNQRHNIVGLLNEDKSIKKEMMEVFKDTLK